MGYCICPEGRNQWGGEHFATREEAVAAAPSEYDLKPGAKFETGLAVPLGLPSIDGATIIEQALCALDDEGGDADEAIDATREQERDLGEMLTATFRQWADKHGIEVKCWTVDDVQQHVVPAAPFAADGVDG